MVKISNWLEEQLDYKSMKELGEELNISSSMISRYLNYKHIPRLSLAVTVFKKFDVVLHPYSKISLIEEGK